MAALPPWMTTSEGESPHKTYSLSRRQKEEGFRNSSWKCMGTGKERKHLLHGEESRDAPPAIQPYVKQDQRWKKHTSRPGEVKLSLCAQPQRCYKCTLMLDEYFHLGVAGHNIRIPSVAIHQQQTHHLGNVAGGFYSQCQNKQIKATNTAKIKPALNLTQKVKSFTKQASRGRRKHWRRHQTMGKDSHANNQNSYCEKVCIT